MIYDILIAGAGTAGLTAGIYAGRSGKSVLIFEGAFPGGAIITSPFIENYPAIKTISGPEFANEMVQQAENAGAKIVYEKIIEADIEGDIKKITTSNGEYLGKTLIIATGTVRRKLGVKNEVEFTGRGVSYCAYCDGAFFRNQTATVVGGGNTALEDAIYLANICKKVYIIHRRDSFKGEETLSKKVFETENIEFIPDTVVEEIIGDDVLKEIKVKNLKTGEFKTIETEGLFVAVGQKAQNEIFSPPVDTDDSGYVKATEDCSTNIPGVYAAGDCRVKTLRQLITASADGAAAVTSATQYINKINGGK